MREKDAVLSAFEEDCRARNYTAQTVINYFGNVRQFREWAVENNVDLIKASKTDIKNYIVYLRGMNLKIRTISRSLTGLTCFYDYLIEEEVIETNPVRPARARYMRQYKKEEPEPRQLVSVEDAGRMIMATLNTRDKAMLMLLFKTGMRRGELQTLDVEDVDMQKMTIQLKPTPKRSNRTLFFDEETARILQAWLEQRDRRALNGTRALLLNRRGTRMKSQDIARAVARAARRIGLHKAYSEKAAEKFSPHCCRHWWTTHMRRAGMPREFIQELRGDVRRDAIDIYDHIDKKELRESYLAHIPQLGV